MHDWCFFTFSLMSILRKNSDKALTFVKPMVVEPSGEYFGLHMLSYFKTGQN